MLFHIALTKGYNKLKKSETNSDFLNSKSYFYISENKRKTEENTNIYL